ncbi:MAG: hypothetical protein JWQ14_2669 [Adhaeribacter sp.]|jgi:hypothetical protein|nr:hypothetical protein [Adhaeribacter sp.]
MRNAAIITCILLILFSLLLIKACNEEREAPANLLTRQWQVVSMRRPHSNSQQYPVGRYILAFQPGNRLTYKLDVNTCTGNYAVNGPGKLKLNILGCTEICCDSDISRVIKVLLPHMDTYTIQDDILTLNGTGQIKLKRVK